MTFFNAAEPVLRRKQENLDFQDRVGLHRIQWQIGEFTVLSRLYTRIDQVFVLWGLVTATIFSVAQFCPISWMTQAVFWTILTLLGTVGMVVLSWFWVTAERLRWVVYCWAGLMLLGVTLTDLGIFAGWWPILLYLCPLWLGLSALGYFCTGVGLRSRTFLLAGLFHLLGIAALSYVAGWQFLTTGLVMTCSLLFLSEVQWDMRPPIEYLLSAEQRKFNQEQHRLRQLVL
jgi:hypothetical protein